jgi:phosphatidylglycerophosphate synthase
LTDLQHSNMSIVPKRRAASGETIARINHHRGSWTEFLPADEDDYPLLNKRYIAFEKAATSFLRKQDFVEPNHITYLRFAVCLFLLFSFGQLSYLQILTLAALGGITDFFDGAFARSASKKTRLGVLIDPLADKLLMLTILYILVAKRALDPRYLVLMAIMETHIIITPLLSLIHDSLVGQRAGRSSYPSLKRDGADVILARTRPALAGRVKVHLYVYAVLSMMLGKAFQISFLSDLAHILLILGICAGIAAYGTYVMRWLKKPMGPAQGEATDLAHRV